MKVKSIFPHSEYTFQLNVVYTNAIILLYKFLVNVWTMNVIMVTKTLYFWVFRYLSFCNIYNYSKWKI